MRKKCAICGYKNELGLSHCKSCGTSISYSAQDVASLKKDLDALRLSFITRVNELGERLDAMQDYAEQQQERTALLPEQLLHIANKYAGFMDERGRLYFSEDNTFTEEVFEKHRRLFDEGLAVILDDETFDIQMEVLKPFDEESVMPFSTHNNDQVDFRRVDFKSWLEEDPILSKYQKDMEDDDGDLKHPSFPEMSTEDLSQLAQQLGGVVGEDGIVLFPVDFSVSADTYYKRCALRDAGKAKIIRASEYQEILEAISHADFPTDTVSNTDASSSPFSEQADAAKRINEEYQRRKREYEVQQRLKKLEEEKAKREQEEKESQDKKGQQDVED